jgi:hypothetical protein
MRWCGYSFLRIVSSATLCSQFYRLIIYEASKSKVRTSDSLDMKDTDTTVGTPLTFCCCCRFLFMMRFTSLFLLASPFVFGQGVFGQGNSAAGKAEGKNSFLRNEGANGSLNTNRNDEAITQKEKRLNGEVPEGLMEPAYDPVLDAVCFTDPAYSPTVADPQALYNDFVKIFDFGFEVSLLKLTLYSSNFQHMFALTPCFRILPTFQRRTME